jgi:phytoene dehydrogenase-like protein
MILFSNHISPLRLEQHARDGLSRAANWLLVDAAAEAGGLACTARTEEGFLFDMGGHVIFSHYDYFDALIDAAIGTVSSLNSHYIHSYLISCL